MGQPQQPAAQPEPGSLHSPMQPAAGPTGQYISNPANGTVNSFTPNPFMTTNQYQTGPSTDAQGAVNGISTVVSGKGTLTQPSYEQQQQAQLDAQLSEGQTRLKADLASKSFKERLAAISQQGATAPHVGGANVPFDENAARGAAFARAKETAGQNAVAAMNAIKEASESMGQMGSSVEGQRIGAAMGGAAGDINDFTRERMIQDFDRAGRISDRNYAGDITQRGQDMQAKNALLALVNASGSIY